MIRATVYRSYDVQDDYGSGYVARRITTLLPGVIHKAFHSVGHLGGFQQSDVRVEFHEGHPLDRNTPLFSVLVEASWSDYRERELTVLRNRIEALILDELPELGKSVGRLVELCLYRHWSY